MNPSGRSNASFRELWATIFTGEFERNPFQSPHWEFLLLSEDLSMDSARWGWLQRTLEEQGERSLIISSVLGANAREVDWRGSSLDERLEPLRSTLLVHDDVYLFSTRCSWGMVCTSGDFSILGGGALLLARFVEFAGGRDRLKEEFLDWVRSGPWFVPTHITEYLLKSAGWR